MTQHIELLPRPFLSTLIARSLSRGSCSVEDEAGFRESIGPVFLAKAAIAAARDWTQRGRMLAHARRQVTNTPAPVDAKPDLAGRPLYLRTDLAFGLASGGSVGHIAGVLNNLSAFTGSPIFATTDAIPTVDPAIETWLVRPDGRFRDFPHIQSIAFDGTRELRRRLAGSTPAFVYQRYSLNNYTGAQLAAQLGVPFALEYNGSEVWITQVWGGNDRLPNQDLSEEIELFNLRRASVIVVVSSVMRDELISRGIDEHRILVNPNGVDADRYRPDVDGTPIREELGVQDETVLGFIGTFGPWHGAEVLADAYGRLLRRHPRYRSSTRLLMIGDGDRLAESVRRTEAGGATAETIYVGRTRQEDGPRYLAACDVLVSPHVPNPDGSRFFGSPTKLFEYMAMGRGIVASRLEQIGEVLEHDQTAWLVEPGDADQLVEGLRVLIEDNSRRQRLGEAARRAAVERHTWREHTRRIVERLAAGA